MHSKAKISQPSSKRICRTFFSLEFRVVHGSSDPGLFHRKVLNLKPDEGVTEYPVWPPRGLQTLHAAAPATESALLSKMLHLSPNVHFKVHKAQCLQRNVHF